MVKEVNQVATDTANHIARYKPSLYRGTNQTSPTDCYSGALVTCIYLLMFPVVSETGKSSNETCCPIQACDGKVISRCCILPMLGTTYI